MDEQQLDPVERTEAITAEKLSAPPLDGAIMAQPPEAPGKKERNIQPKTAPSMKISEWAKLIMRRTP